jgi:tetratricopeptide (TPR) repeat protein
MRPLIYSLFVFILSFNSYFAQNRIIDSLTTHLTALQEDSNKVKTHLKLFGEFYKINDFKPCFNNLEKGLELAEKINYKKGIISCSGNLGRLYSSQANYPKALFYYNKSLKIALEIKSKQAITSSYTNIGIVYKNLSEYSKALIYYQKNLKLAEENKDTSVMASTYLNIGNLYEIQQREDQALDYYNKALYLSQQINDIQSIIAGYITIGQSYYKLKEYDQAIKYTELAIKNAETNEQYKYYLSFGYGNMGLIYKDKKEYTKALDFYLKSIKVTEELGDKNTLSKIYTTIGELYNILKDLKLAKVYLLKGYNLSVETNTPYNLIFANSGLAENAFYSGNYKDAYLYHVRYKSINDSIFNIENSKQLSDVKTSFEVQKKEIELKAIAKADSEKMQLKAEEDKKRQNLIIYCILAGFVMVSLFSMFIFRGLQKIKVANQIITKQKQLVEQQKDILEEKQKEILDSIRYAKRIQQSLLPSEKYIERELNKL